VTVAVTDTVAVLATATVTVLMRVTVSILTTVYHDVLYRTSYFLTRLKRSLRENVAHPSIT